LATDTLHVVHMDVLSWIPTGVFISNGFSRSVAGHEAPMSNPG
jgi:hypothetical protein